MLGQWVDAAKDLHLASKLDFDEEINNVLKKVCSSLSYPFSLIPLKGSVHASSFLG